MVYKLATIDNGKVYAVKEIEKRKFMKNGILDHKVNNELKIIRKLRHVSQPQLASVFWRWFWLISTSPIS